MKIAEPTTYLTLDANILIDQAVLVTLKESGLRLATLFPV